MLFNSYFFILCFLPACLGGYYCLNHFQKYDWGQLFLLAMSLWFYAYFHFSYLFIIMGSVMINYLIYYIFLRVKGQQLRKWVLGAGLAVNIGVLLYFKYMDFFIRNVNAVFHKEYLLLGILLPLGISFFTFQQISFIVDAYRGEVSACSFLYYASFVTFFPQLVAGPIVTHDELIPQFRDRERKRFNWDYAAEGIYIFVLGLSKKVLLADTFGNAVNLGYEKIDTLNATSALLVMLFYTIQIYFDFSGYCDMAVGIGKLFHVDIPINFNSPYKARTIAEFWDRWHMTLTRFFTKYVYIPLGGSRRGAVRTYLNVLLVFFASGFWHGAEWTFVFWGVLHGLSMVAARRFKGALEKIPAALSWFLTFAFVNVAWVFFRADSMGQAFRFLKRIGSCDFGKMDEELLTCFRLTEIDFALKRLHVEMDSVFIMTAFLALSLLLILFFKNNMEKMGEFYPTLPKLAASAVLLVWCIFSFSGISTFLYFNF